MLVARLIAGEQILAVLGVEEFSQRLDAADDEEKIVLAFEGKHRIDEIVPRALIAELDFETVGEERIRSSLVQAMTTQRLGYARLQLSQESPAGFVRPRCSSCNQHRNI